jgi:hypothetical protein
MSEKFYSGTSFTPSSSDAKTLTWGPVFQRFVTLELSNDPQL